MGEPKLKFSGWRDADGPIPVDPQGKFEREDLPKILAALHKAKHASAPGTVTVSFAADGGVISVTRELKEKIK